MWPALLHVEKRTSVRCSSLLPRVSKSIGLALWLEGNLPFLLFFFTLYLRAIFQHKSLGGLYLEGRIHGGAYFGSLRYTRLEAVVRTISTGRFVSIYFSIRRKEKFSSTDKFITKISWTLFFDP